MTTYPAVMTIIEHYYHEGVRARAAGIPLTASPYPPDSPEGYSWRCGWYDDTMAAA